MFLNKAHLEVKQQSEIYLKYQFGEALVIIISTVLEIALMHRMLNKQYLV